MICTKCGKEIYYFETVDNKVFAYCKQSVYEVKERLYQLDLRQCWKMMRK